MDEEASTVSAVWDELRQQIFLTRSRKEREEKKSCDGFFVPSLEELSSATEFRSLRVLRVLYVLYVLCGFAASRLRVRNAFPKISSREFQITPSYNTPL